MLRIVFMGSDAVARPALDWLAGEGAEGVRGDPAALERAEGRRPHLFRVDVADAVRSAR